MIIGLSPWVRRFTEQIINSLLTTQIAQNGKHLTRQSQSQPNGEAPTSIATVMQINFMSIVVILHKFTHKYFTHQSNIFGRSHYSWPEKSWIGYK